MLASLELCGGHSPSGGAILDRTVGDISPVDNTAYEQTVISVHNFFYPIL